VRIPIVAICLCLLLPAGAVRAGEYELFPGPAIDSSTLRFKTKVEEIYSSGNYERALFIYANELAPRGDKYAQYMVGYMHLTGRGVEKDPAAALAWYRLAAERGEPKFIEAREALEASLDPAEVERAATLFPDLWQRYGDRRLLLDLIREDLAILARKSAPTPANAGTEIITGYSHITGDPYFRRVRQQLTERLRYLDAMPQAPRIEGSDGRVGSLEASVRQELRKLDLP
jgi:hypothetical protein